MVSEPTMANDASAIFGSSGSSLQRDESTNQLFLHHGDSPGTILVSQPLSGENYNTWSRSMIMALTAKNKIGFINGTITAPNDETLPSFNLWTRSQEMWEELNERFAQGNAPRVFEIQKAISSLIKDQCNVSTYFTKLKSLWDELNNYRFFPPCSRGALKILTENKQQENVMQFLMGLNDSFVNVRAQILMMEPLPAMNKVFSLVVQEERQRGIGVPSMTATGDSIALYTRFETPRHNYGGRGQFGKKHRGILWINVTSSMAFHLATSPVVMHMIKLLCCVHQQPKAIAARLLLISLLHCTNPYLSSDPSLTVLLSALKSTSFFIASSISPFIKERAPKLVLSGEVEFQFWTFHASTLGHIWGSGVLPLMVVQWCGAVPVKAANSERIELGGPGSWRHGILVMMKKIDVAEAMSQDGTVIAKFFPSGNILEASEKNRGSFAWHSILKAKALILSGFNWRVGDGSRIPIKGSNWLPDEEHRRVLSPLTDLPKDARVTELIHGSPPTWNINKDGKYSVRSGYKLLLRDAQGSQPEIMCWLLWHKRNHDRLHLPSEQYCQIWTRAQAFLHEYLTVTTEEKAERPKPPPKVYSTYTVEMIEALTAKRAVIFAKEVGIDDVEVEGDTETVMRYLSSNVPLHTPYGLVLEDTKVLIQEFQRVTLSHTRRSGNSVAHALARRASDCNSFLVWMEEVPPDITHVLLNDFFALS
uniref:Retrotransposon Copia-like N-terminal domain-containing protein n=1 Tax=Fagus sylvatica TaxID=28930 RepID=A0A2N9FPS4_FAGSY